MLINILSYLNLVAGIILAIVGFLNIKSNENTVGVIYILAAVLNFSAFIISQWENLL
jgi:hypothetical protein